MRKIKDRLLLGVVCGLLGSGIVKIINPIEYKAGLTDLRFNQPAASLFLSKKEALSNSFENKVIALVVNNTMVSATGSMIVYLLSKTGRDYAVLKGAGVGLMQWIGIWGFLSRIGVTVKSNKALTHILSFVDHALFGAATGYLASKLGDDSLFHESLPQEKPEASQSKVISIFSE